MHCCIAPLRGRLPWALCVWSDGRIICMAHLSALMLNPVTQRLSVLISSWSIGCTAFAACSAPNASCSQNTPTPHTSHDMHACNLKGITSMHSTRDPAWMHSTRVLLSSACTQRCCPGLSNLDNFESCLHHNRISVWLVPYHSSSAKLKVCNVSCTNVLRQLQECFQQPNCKEGCLRWSLYTETWQHMP